MAEAVRFLVAGLPAEIVREIGLRLRGVAVTEFEGTQQIGRAASQGEAKLVLLSDTLPTQDSIYIARRAIDANDAVRIAFCISMAQAEGVLQALKEIRVDRFFLSPVDVEEMLRELARMCGVEVLAPQESHGDNIAAAVFDAWDRARATTFKKIDALDDAAIANRARQFVELGVGECAARIVRVRLEQLDRHTTLTAAAVGRLGADVADQRSESAS